MLKTIFKRALIGFVIGILLGDGIAVFESLFSGGPFRPFPVILEQFFGSAALAFTVQTLASGLYGAVCFAGTVIYELDRIPLTAATAIHCLSVVLLFPVLGLTLGWLETMTEIIIMAVIQSAAYFVVWLILFFSYRKQVKELNALQKQIQDKSDSQNTDSKEEVK